MKGKPPLKQSGSSLYAHLTRWQTSDELKFIEHLGSWTKHHHTEEEKRFLLIQYKKAMALRSDWGMIDRNAVEAFVNECLKKGGETDGEAKAGNR